MRELKFRSWVEKGTFKKMFEAFTLREALEEEEPGAGEGACADYIYMQFTGLLDKNGKEIFEGDIVSDENGTIAIEWAAGMGAWGLLDSDECMFMLADCHSTMEVIGNIYETPELLKP